MISLSSANSLLHFSFSSRRSGRRMLLPSGTSLPFLLSSSYRHLVIPFSFFFHFSLWSSFLFFRAGFIRVAYPESRHQRCFFTCRPFWTSSSLMRWFCCPCYPRRPCSFLQCSSVCFLRFLVLLVLRGAFLFPICFLAVPSLGLA